jgi:hypothetical protein
MKDTLRVTRFRGGIYNLKGFIPPEIHSVEGKDAGYSVGMHSGNKMRIVRLLA